MMVNIIQDFIPAGRRNRPGHKLEPLYLTIHDTANTDAGADARAHAAYLKTYPDLLASWHFTVDDRFIYQHLPLNENGWHAGDGVNGTGNRQSIGIEICENSDGDRSLAEKNAAWLTAGLLVNFSLTPERVKQHYDWSGKNCPRVLRGRSGGWSGFLSAVESYLFPAPGTPLTGAAAVEVARAVQWARGNQAHTRFLDIASVYWKYGEETGIRPEALYAQSARETAFGRYGGAVKPEQNNWAGIKVANPVGDQGGDHESFSSPEEGVRAHFNHIAAYVGLEPVGEPHPRHWVVEGLSWAGTVKYIEELGGKWAPAHDYGTIIVENYLKPLLDNPEPPYEPDPPGDETPEPEPGDPAPPQELEEAKSFFHLIISFLRKLLERLKLFFTSGN